MTEQLFKSKCNKISKKLLGFDAFEEGDPYDIECLVKHALKVKKTPRQFIEETFDEDIWKKDYNKYLEEESRKNQHE